MNAELKALCEKLRACTLMSDPTFCVKVASALEAMGAELEAASKTAHEHYQPQIDELVGEINELRLQVEALRKDAGRYRWIREHSWCGPGTSGYDPTKWDVGDPRPETLDAHIDAAMGQDLSDRQQQGQDKCITED